jgi:hypothetical protein
MMATWSNRGELLTSITDVWVAERTFMWNKIDVGGRSVIIKCQNNNELLVHSPIESTVELTKELKKMGEVKWIISPNYEHLKYAKQWSEVYPNANMCGCPGLPERLPDIKWSYEFTNPSSNLIFPKEFEICHMDCEINPFTSKPFFNEVIFFHKPSKSLFMADLFWNYPSSSLPNYYDIISTSNSDSIEPIPVPFGTKLWKFGMDKIYLPFYKTFMVGKSGLLRQKYDELVSRILSWNTEIIIPCHGDIIRGEVLCREVLTKHFLS